MDLVQFKNGNYAIRRWSEHGYYEFFESKISSGSWVKKESMNFEACLFAETEKDKALKRLEKLSDMGTVVETRHLNSEGQK